MRKLPIRRVIHQINRENMDKHRNKSDGDRRRFDAITKSGELRDEKEDPRFLLKYASDHAFRDSNLLYRISRRDGLASVKESLKKSTDHEALKFLSSVRGHNFTGLDVDASINILAGVAECECVIGRLEELCQRRGKGGAMKEGQVLSWFVLTVAKSNAGSHLRPELKELANVLITMEVYDAEHLKALFSDGVSLVSGAPTEHHFGRHDNDKYDWRDICIPPTVDEIVDYGERYFPKEMNVEGDYDDSMGKITSMHLERHFRMAREDLLGPLRESLQESDQNRSKLRRYGNVKMERVTCNVKTKTQAGNQRAGDQKAGLLIVSVEFLQGYSVAKAKDFWKSEMAKRILPENALVVLYNSKKKRPIGFAKVAQRKDDDLRKRVEGKGHLQHRPEVGLDISVSHENAVAILECFNRPHDRKHIELIQTSAAIFAYQPFLASLQKMDRLPFSDEILLKKHSSQPAYLSEVNVDREIEMLERDDGFRYDDSQKDAIRSALGSTVSLTQGPPGTGKTHLGSRLVKIIVERTNAKVLCVTVTNHACDDFLLEVEKAGVKKSDIIRIGRCPTDDNKDTEWLRKQNLYELKNHQGRDGDSSTSAYHCFKEIDELTTELREVVEKRRDLSYPKPKMQVIRACLEEAEVKTFDAAFKLPPGFKPSDGGKTVKSPSGFTIQGVAIWTLWEDWCKGEKLRDVFTGSMKHHQLWLLSPKERNEKLQGITLTLTLALALALALRLTWSSIQFGRKHQ